MTIHLRLLPALALLALVPACDRPAPVTVPAPPRVVEDAGAIPPPRAVPLAAEPSDAKDAMELFVVARANGRLKVQYPQGQRVLLDPTDDTLASKLVLPANRPVKFTCISDDGAAAFEVPAFALAVEAKVGKYTSATVKPTRPGTFGVWNGRHVGSVAVVSAQEFDAWLAGTDEPPGKGPADGSPAHAGRQLFLKLHCVNCHSGTATAKAPHLEGLFGKKEALKGGGAETVDEGYIVESIRKPKAKVVEGWEPIMPAYDNVFLTDEEMGTLVAYIKSLKPGGLKPKEQFPAPVGAPK